jgi:cellulose biosynthesis protein BcsQ
MSGATLFGVLTIQGLLTTYELTILVPCEPRILSGDETFLKQHININGLHETVRTKRYRVAIAVTMVIVTCDQMRISNLSR